MSRKRFDLATISTRKILMLLIGSARATERGLGGANAEVAGGL